MTTNELKERIEKKQEQINKIEKRLAKWIENRDSEKAFEKEYSWLSTFESRKEDFKQDWIKDCEREINCANRDLEEAKQTLIKYQNAYMIADEKENKPVIQIFKNFFNNWKQEIKDFVEPLYQKYLELNSESCDLHNRKYRYLETMSEEEYKAKCDEVRKQERELLSITWVSLRREKRNEFDKFLDKYMEDRYYELVDKVTKFTGNITNVSELYVGNDGSLNGIIIGENGKAKIETIIAGGYNIQCLHYRVLVKEVK